MNVLIKGLEMPETGYMDVRIFRDGTATIATGTKPYYREFEAVDVSAPHGRLIYADSLMLDSEQYHLSDGKFQHWVEVQPTIDAEPARHVKNVGTDYDEIDQFVCSECGIELQGWHRVEHDEDDGVETVHEYRLRYCPNCGGRIVEE